MFQISESTAHNFFNYWQNIFQEELPLNLLEQVKKYLEDFEKIREELSKNELIVDSAEKAIVDVVVGKPGPTSDLKICRSSLKQFDSQQSFSGDKAYAGESQITTPLKKPKNGELTRPQKEENKKTSSKRICVEHLIRIIKIFKIAREKFRWHKKRYKSVILTACSLVRLRIGSLILKIIELAESGKIIYIVISHSFAAELNFGT